MIPSDNTSGSSRSFSLRHSLLLGAIGAAALVASACGSVASDEELAVDTATLGQALSQGGGHGGKKHSGKELFETPFDGTNGRACSSCHVASEHFVLTPAHVEALLESNPDDPLFNRLDADDPDAEVLTFEHLKKGLVRVVLPLPANMDLIDFDGNVVTPPDRMYSVWRAVPTSENAIITAPYQYDGRFDTLQQQAQGAITAHSEGPNVKAKDLNAIAAFQQDLFTSNRAKWVGKKMAKGVPVEQIERPELRMDDLTPSQERGLEIYNAACEVCHGGATTMQITDRVIHDLAFVELKADGNVLFDTSVQPPVPVLAPEPNNEFLNIGLGNISELGQIFGDLFGPRFNASVELPRYRFRFYTDGTRSVQVTDLPPIPQTLNEFPFDLRALTDENGAPIVGPNFLPQWWSTDPGRAGITGNPHDFEAFDVPPLRGIANTAPFFHDNSAETLRDAVDIYSRFILQFFAPLNLPLVNPPEPGSFFPESLTPQQKDDLMAFLTIL